MRIFSDDRRGDDHHSIGDSDGNLSNHDRLYRDTARLGSGLRGASVPVAAVLLIRRKMQKNGIWPSMGLLVALVLGLGAMNGCGGGSSFTAPPQNTTHQVKSSATVTLTVQ